MTDATFEFDVTDEAGPNQRSKYLILDLFVK